MMMLFKNKRVWFYSGFGLFVALCLVGILQPAGNSMTISQIRQKASEMQMESIGRQLRTYQSNHVSRPNSLAEVMTNFLSTDRPDSFNVLRHPYRSRDWTPREVTNQQFVDDHTDYQLAENTNLVLAFEKPNLWSDGKMMVLLSDGSVKCIKISEAAKYGLQIR